MENCKPLYECLACGSRRLRQTLDLGVQPLANNFKASRDVADPVYPLVVNRCEDCDHLQLTHAVDPAIIYTHYLYVSGTSRTYLEYMDWYARFVREQMPTWPPSVLDIGCNDGSQLDAFRRIGITTFGVDPAKNLFAGTQAKGHHVLCGFWNEETAALFGDQRFAIISTQNAFAHIPDPLAYLKLAKQYLAYGGKIFISTSQADMVVNGEFDTIYHEHISFYNAESMRRLAERAGLYLSDVVKTPIHGTSYIFVLSQTPTNTYRMKNILEMEQNQGIHDPALYTKWQEGVVGLLGGLTNKLNFYKNSGYQLIGYGAAAKGMTLLNAAGLELDVVIDDNPLKQGTFCPGVNTPVVGVDYLDTLGTADRAVFIPLAWNFFKEIKTKILSKRNSSNDRFVKYYPQIEIE